MKQNCEKLFLRGIFRFVAKIWREIFLRTKVIFCCCVVSYCWSGIFLCMGMFHGVVVRLWFIQRKCKPRINDCEVCQKTAAFANFCFVIILFFVSGKNPCTTASSIFANLSSCVPVVFHFPVMPLINGASQGLKKTVSPIIEQLRQISQKTAITIFRQQEGILLTDFFQKSCQLKKISKTQIFENSRYSKKNVRWRLCKYIFFGFERFLYILVGLENLKSLKLPEIAWLYFSNISNPSKNRKKSIKSEIFA